MNTDIITQAISKLKLLDIVLHESKLARAPDEDPLLYPSNLAQQNKLSVRTQTITYSDEDAESYNLLRSFVNLGARMVTKDDDKKELFKIEATFRVDYLILKDLTEEEIEEFSIHNSVHNVWPFWRQYVFQTVQTAHLPQLNIPLRRLDTKDHKPRKRKPREKLKNQENADK